MSDLVERWKRWLEHTGYDGGVDSPPMLVLHRMETDAARITALETALAEAEGTIAALREKLANSMPIAGGNPFRSAGGSATALETGEWKK